MAHRTGDSSSSENKGYLRCARGLFVFVVPLLAVPGVVFPPVLLLTVLVVRGVEAALAPGPDLLRTCFVCAILWIWIREGDTCDGRANAQQERASTLSRYKTALTSKRVPLGRLKGRDNWLGSDRQ